MTITKFIFFKDTISIYSGLIRLVEEGEYFLFLVILIFSVIFPIAKILTLAGVWYFEWHEVSTKKVLHGVDMLGKWSMLDVFVIAIIITSIKLRLVSQVKTEVGVYIFTIAVILSMITSLRIKSKETLNGSRNIK